MYDKKRLIDADEQIKKQIDKIMLSNYPLPQAIYEYALFLHDIRMTLADTIEQARMETEMDQKALKGTNSQPSKDLRRTMIRPKNNLNSHNNYMSPLVNKPIDSPVPFYDYSFGNHPHLHAANLPETADRDTEDTEKDSDHIDYGPPVNLVSEKNLQLWRKMNEDLDLEYEDKRRRADNLAWYNETDDRGPTAICCIAVGLLMILYCLLH